MQENNKFNRKDILRYCLMGILIFVLLGCFVTSAIVLPVICTNRRQVANATDSVVVDSLQSQASSNYSLQNISTYPRLYGVFFNKSFNLTYDKCVELDSYFMPDGSESRSISIVSTASSSQFNRSFSFSPTKITNEFLSDFGADFTISAPVYSLSVNVSKDAEAFSGTNYHYRL